MNVLTEKQCPKCAEVKPALAFYVSKTRADGLSSYCRTCQLRDSKTRYSPHPRWQAPEGQKWCPGCKDTKLLEAFGANRSTHDGKQQYCKPCAVAIVTKSRHKDPTSHRRSSKNWREANPERHADLNARWRYGIENGTYAKMLEAQGGRCAICATTEPGSRIKRFHVDHCHNSGEVRGLLCENCNRGIGLLKHDVDILAKAQLYLLGITSP